MRVLIETDPDTASLSAVADNMLLLSRLHVVFTLHNCLLPLCRSGLRVRRMGGEGSSRTAPVASSAYSRPLLPRWQH